MGEGGIKPVDHIKAMEKLTRWGWAATIGWALLGLLLLAAFHPKGDWSGIEFNEVGDFSAGFFAPLGFLWFVIALFHQRRQIAMQAEELSLQRQELQETRKTLEAQRDEMAESARQAKAQAEALMSSFEIHRYQHLTSRISTAEIDIQNLLNRNIAKFFPDYDNVDNNPLTHRVLPYMCVDFYIEKINLKLSDGGYFYNTFVENILNSNELIHIIQEIIDKYNHIEKLIYNLDEKEKNNYTLYSEYAELNRVFSDLYRRVEERSSVKNAN